MPVFNSSPRLRAGGIFAVVVGLGLLVGVGTVASAEPMQQAAPTPVSCVALKPGVQIILGNPQPGDTILTGTNPILQGIAYDSRATSGSGILSVQIYLGDRNAGGTSLGTALLGMPNPQAGPGSPFATAGFTLRTPTLPVGSGSRSIFVYAKSSVTDTEATLEVPVYLNSAPTPVKGQVPTAVIPPPPNCTPTPAPTATTAATPTAVPAAAVAPGAPVVAPVPAVTPTPFPTLAPLPAPVVPAPVAPAAVAAATPLTTTAPGAVTPAVAQTTAPRGGGIPSELGLAVLAAGALIVGGGISLRRRQRRPTPVEAEL